MPRGLTLADVAVAHLMRSGQSRWKAHMVAAQALAYAWQLAYASTKLDHWPTQADYAAYWELNRRTAERHWATFREAFGDQADINDVAKHLRDQLGSRIDRSSAALSAPAPPELQPA
jgi:hypothetical protein